MIDIGVNLTHPSLLTNLDQNKQQWEQEGIQSVIAIASNIEESKELSNLCNNYNNTIHHTIGCHPHYANSWNEDSNAIIEKLNKLSKNCIAIGETGLDFNRNYSSQEEQVEAFQAQVQLASDLSLPLYLHERDAEETLQSILRNQIGSQVKGVLHCFTGSKEALRRYLDFGLYIGITGWVCDERRGQDLQEAIHYIPKDRILFETDSPFLLPRTIRPRPKKNHPKYLQYVIEQVAILSNTDINILKEVSMQNSKKLFNI